MAGGIVRVGIVGAGNNTRVRHIPGLRAVDGVEIVSVCNRSRESSERVAGQFEIPRVYDSWLDLVKADDTDAICIGTWPYMHCPVTLAALENGKHVLCEARMAMNAQEAHAMLAAARRRPHLVTQIVPSPLRFKVDRTIQEHIAGGYLGDLLAIDVRAAQTSFVDAQSPVAWRQDRDLSGFNILNMGIWYEALMRWAGPASEVRAIQGVRTKPPQRAGRASDANCTGPRGHPLRSGQRCAGAFAVQCRHRIGRGCRSVALRHPGDLTPGGPSLAGAIWWPARR